MGDFEEQQSMEIEALESILMDDLQEVKEGVPSTWKPRGKVYLVEVIPQLEDGTPGTPGDYLVGAEVVFAHTPLYPDEPPLVRARSLRGLADIEVAHLQSCLDEQIEANLGMPMVYTLITTTQDWINDKGAERATPVVDPDAERKRLQEEEEARIAELRRHGTQVTPETFKAWKERFDAEMQLAKAVVTEATATAAAAVKGKLTGKAWFLQQEAQHIEIEEPDLEDDEEDAEADRSRWSGDEEEFEDVSEDEDDDMLDDLLASRVEGS